MKEFTRWLCWELLDACGNQALPARNLALKSYPPFKPLATGHEKQSMDRVLGEMEDAGLRGKVWSREELEQFVGRQASSSSNEL